ncbi:hypothetical protein C4D60_Mb01t02460 [Musa balbisiana]|uniref:RRM domain-containing protein n=1 Tax=Musa balbisiana TaxID=52838 RepID=A0A4V4H726_MUSBA|nr:hypothetical protein C4D60_Mb01t02460 [Musa balbisiana]
MEFRNERNDLASTVSSSHQIYLTFPAESTFTEDDVSNYFRQFGQVRDVRIPCQDKRMFGFVSFVHPETVNVILMKRNPHYVCGARVLVKPYREKSKVIDRMYSDKIKPHYPSRYLDVDHDVHSVPRESDTSSLLGNHLIEKEMMEHLSGLNLAPNTQTQHDYLGHGGEDLKVSEGPSNLFLDHFSYSFDAMNNGSTSYDKARQTSNSFGDQEKREWLTYHIDERQGVSKLEETKLKYDTRVATPCSFPDKYRKPLEHKPTTMVPTDRRLINKKIGQEWPTLKFPPTVDKSIHQKESMNSKEMGLLELSSKKLKIDDGDEFSAQGTSSSSSPMTKIIPEKKKRDNQSPLIDSQQK